MRKREDGKEGGFPHFLPPLLSRSQWCRPNVAIKTSLLQGSEVERWRPELRVRTAPPLLLVRAAGSSRRHACQNQGGVLYQQLKKELEKEFPGKLEMTGEGTRESTGWFEVTVAGKLVHSKKNGDGFVDDSAKLKKIIMAIKAALA
ncbi:Selenoprotein W [Podarcis lilfordi]|uniref:Selenoprotein W n=1 Tax=Podarcis lilfordi TaxID=74358 RepID=A0AA35PCJ6_9SAUR|nr:Selenoprotein W [Podarcis lilfordi]